MTVQRIQLHAIEAKRFTAPGERTGQIRIDHNSTVTLVKEISESEASVDFRYTASYGSVGIIRLEGNLNFTGDAQSLHSQWSQTNQMPSEIASEIHTAVMRVCVPEAVGIAKNLQLPPPIPLPQVRFGDKGGQAQNKGASEPGPEIA